MVSTRFPSVIGSLIPSIVILWFGDGLKKCLLDTDGMEPHRRLLGLSAN